MIIQQKRIHNLEKYTWFLKKNQTFCVSVNIDQTLEAKLAKRWVKIDKNTLFLPNIVGPVSRFNAEWKEEVQKHLPKEKCFREVEWHRKQWVWRWRVEEHSKICYVPYERYPRKEILPPSCELTISDNKVISEQLVYDSKNDNEIKHVINLFLELFGYCELLDDKQIPLFDISKCKKLNWIFINHGWKWLSEHVSAILKSKSKSKAEIIKYRLEVMKNSWLEPVGVWSQGFKWYIAFQWNEKKITIFENYNYGNAIYISDSDREEFSQKNKSEILWQNLQIAKIVHNEWWENKLKKFA